MNDELEVIEAVKWCWDNGIKIFPVVSPLKEEREGPPGSWRPAKLNSLDKVKICVQIGKNMKYGTIEYAQNDKLYKKIEELYMHYYSNRKSV